MTTPLSQIRNFAIIAHIDHGKSTLADRLIQACGGLEAREMREQVLDTMEIERERGITIKAQTVRLDYKARDGESYVLNLMDTPGHVDFAYEVSRSLAACEGVILLVDASQGIEAQTLANCYQALEHDLTIVAALNKIDLPAAEPEKVKQQIEDVIGLDASNAIHISAKTGLNIAEVLEAIVTRLPPPKGDVAAPLKALLVDSWYDAYLGVVVLLRVVDGTLKKGQRIHMMRTDATYEVDRVGVFTPKMLMVDELGPGEIGFITAQIKEVADTRVGDTRFVPPRPLTDRRAAVKLLVTTDCPESTSVATRPAWFFIDMAPNCSSIQKLSFSGAGTSKIEWARTSGATRYEVEAYSVSDGRLIARKEATVASAELPRVDTPLIVAVRPRCESVVGEAAYGFLPAR